MLFDCAIIGGGPAGLNAALVLGRARRRVILFDDSKPRHAVTRASHGFITRDGISPGEFRQAAYRDLSRYPAVQCSPRRIVDVNPSSGFRLTTDRGESYAARTLLLATGLQESLPSVPGIRDYYGISLFNCPYCDGWELQGQPLVVISEQPQAFAMARTVSQWSRDLLVCTNGRGCLTDSQIRELQQKGIGVYEQPIRSLQGDNGRLHCLQLGDGTILERSGGFVATTWFQAAPFGRALGCRITPEGGLMTDGFGRTSTPGVYGAGDISGTSPSQLIVAAAEGSRAAVGINADLTRLDF